jgi:RNA polymerase sigma-70 factor (ECF subfamily)
MEAGVSERVSAGGDDATLALSLAAGDSSALADLYDRYGSLAYSLALRILGDPGRAEDAVQEVFLKVWQRAASFDPQRGSLRSWLLTAVRNRSLDGLRGRAGSARSELELEAARVLPASEAADPWRQVSQAIQRDAVREALDRLPAEQRQAIELAYYGGYTCREIAVTAGVPVSTVKGRLRLGLEKLHSYLDGKGLFDER